MRTRLQPGEEVQILVRRHGIVLVAPVGLAIFFAGCLLAAWWAPWPQYLMLASAGVTAVAAGWALAGYFSWRCDLWAVTPQRVIDESGVFTVTMIDSPLETIHNISCEQSVFGRMLGYGTLNIQTAASHGSTTIPDVASPADLRETILSMKNRARQGQAAGRTGPATAAPHAAALGYGPAAGSMNDPGGRAAAAGIDTKECPFCAETIKARATLCRFCGRNL